MFSTRSHCFSFFPLFFFSFPLFCSSLVFLALCPCFSWLSVMPKTTHTTALVQPWLVKLHILILCVWVSVFPLLLLSPQCCLLLCNNSCPEALSCREGMRASYFKSGMLKKDLDLVYPLERGERGYWQLNMMARCRICVSFFLFLKAQIVLLLLFPPWDNVEISSKAAA